MHSVNVDLLRAATHRTDLHAHHRAAHLADLRAARRQRWQDRIARLRALCALLPAPAPQTCQDRLS